MVDEIKAFKCGITGNIFESQKRAVDSEFRARMGQAGGSLPCWGSINSIEMMRWIASQIESDIYPTVLDKLLDALNYYKENRPVSNGDHASG